VRLNSAIGYITPKEMLAGHPQEIEAERDGKLEAAVIGKITVTTVSTTSTLHVVLSEGFYIASGSG
jgi:hypothetical protein